MSQTLSNGVAVLVDQNAFHQKILRNLLRSTGFSRVVEFTGFEEGLDEATRTRSDFLFADYDTARKSEILRVNGDLRKSHLTNGTNLIFLMQNPTRKRVKSAIASGANWVISRPFSPTCLYERINATLYPDSVAAFETERERRDVNVIELTSPPKETEEQRIKRLLKEMDELLKNSPYFDVDELSAPQKPKPTTNGAARRHNSRDAVPQQKQSRDKRTSEDNRHWADENVFLL
ncbi:hypothetical protein [uncultured Cohaesibacter sp.]|uniref:hypothetical protein n=1 Tax=uncultured Cohaesibacter sp. TaxID=1002546 RepID=UPI0029C67E0F|nr:hypothetical protein [uncultured Cohaesibacter sp.]